VIAGRGMVGARLDAAEARKTSHQWYDDDG
jgi:hypothetical protein